MKNRINKRLTILIFVLLYTGCYSYIGTEIPNRLNEKFLSENITDVSFTITCNKESQINYYSDLVKDDLIKSTLFKNVKLISRTEKKEANHFDIYIFNGSSYRSGWLTGISSIFMGLTAGLLPGIDQRDHKWTVNYYSEGKFKYSANYSQSHNKIFGIIPLFLHFIKNNKSDQRPMLAGNIVNNLLYDYINTEK